MQPSDPDVPLYSIAAVSRRTGVPAVTLRAWERRYGFPRPRRAPGGRRLYSERDVDAVRVLRAQSADGVPISRAIALLRDQTPAPSADPEGGSPVDLIGRRLLGALLDLAPGRAEAVLSEAFGLLSVEDVCLDVVQPALNEIDRRWQAGEASIAQEHFASALIRARLARLLQSMPGDDRQAVVLAACPPGEWHEIGLLTVCLFLARRGLSVRYLGPNLPVADFVALARRSAPRIVVLSAQTDASADRLADVLRCLRDLPSPRPALAYGGSIFNARPELRARMPGTFLGSDAHAAVATVRRLLQEPDAETVYKLGT